MRIISFVDKETRRHVTLEEVDALVRVCLGLKLGKLVYYKNWPNVIAETIKKSCIYSGVFRPKCSEFNDNFKDVYEIIFSEFEVRVENMTKNNRVHVGRVVVVIDNI